MSQKVNNTLVKIRIEFPKGSWHRKASESIWAIKTASDNYILDNSPFYAYNISYKDTVTAKPDKFGRLVFTGIQKRSGHSTYRVYLNKVITIDIFLEYWERFNKYGCTYEGADKKLFSIDVPPKANIYEVYKLLEAGVQDGIWDFEEAHVGHKL